MADHGTIAGYSRHRRVGELPCEECREAKRLYEREAKRRYRADPQWAAHEREQVRERYATDADYRESVKAGLRRRYHAKAGDPEFLRAERERRAPADSSDKAAAYRASREVAPQNFATRSARQREIRTFTAVEAARAGAPYTPEEDAAVLRTDLTRAEIALTLGRSLASVDYRRRYLRKRNTNPKENRNV